jgi:hypothetical protein
MGRRLEPLILAATLSLAACSDDTVGPTAGKFEELCGVTAPLRLLPLDPERIPISVQTRIYAERYVFSLRFGEGSVDDVHEIWSSGRCGEDPVQLTDGGLWGIWNWEGFEPWAGVPFVCNPSGGRILALDPSGAQPPHEVFETRECFYLASAAGLVSILGEGETGPLVLQRWPADPMTDAAEQVVLVDEVRAHVLSSPDAKEGAVLRTTANEVFAITAANELIAVSLDDLAMSVLAEDVRRFDIGPSGRYVAWQSVEINNDDPDWLEGPVFLLDRESGVTTKLDESALIDGRPPLPLEALGLLYYSVGPIFDETAGRWVRLGTLESYPMLAHLTPYWRIDDSRAVLASSRWFNSPPFYLLDVSNADLTLLYDGPGSIRYVHENGLYIQDGDRLIDVSFTGETRTLARYRTGLPLHMLSGERVLTPFAVGENSIGDLVIVDPDTLDESYVDHGVNADSISTHEWPIEGDRRFDGDLVSYMVVDADPERHGIWLAKPAK